MGELYRHSLVRPLAGLLSPELELLQTAQSALSQWLGPIAQRSEAIPFTHTEYYNQEMGLGIFRQFVVFAELKPAEALPDWKLASNALEKSLGLNSRGGRQVNIDPGYLAPGRLVLASTKDHEQRIYLRDGIYAENTLRIRNKRFCTWEWSYPDYAEAADFFNRAYQDYLQVLASNKAQV